MQLDDAFTELALVQDFIPVRNSNRPGTKLTPRFITIHNTDNESPGANAAAHAKYQKGQEARNRQVSWHFTVDDRNVYQSLPTNEVGWHAGTAQGNASSIGIEICMHPEMDTARAYRRAALLVAVMARRLEIPVPNGVVQHNRWSGKNCPRVLRNEPDRWTKFLQSAADLTNALQDVPTAEIGASGGHDHLSGGAMHADLQPSALTAERSVVMAKAGLRLRAGPGTDFDVITNLAFGTPVSVVSRFGDWSMVDLGADGGGDGFVHSAFLKSL